MSSPIFLPASWLRTLVGAVLFAASAHSFALPSEPAGNIASASADALRAMHQRMSGKLERSSFGRPIQLDSQETPSGLQGDIHAVVDHSLPAISAALKQSSQWCELLVLHINNRRCRAGSS